MRLTKYITCLLLVLIISSAKAQSANDAINPKAFNSQLVQTLFLKELNALRTKIGVPELKNDALLTTAAIDQAAYCMSKSMVTHYQTNNPQKYNVADRIKYYKGLRPVAGENCLMILINSPMRDGKTQETIVINTYAQLAHQMFLNWKNSPEHYKNMINGVYTNTGFGLSLFENGNVLYATQVFATAQYYPPKNGLPYSDTTFGVKESFEVKCKGYNDNDYLATIFSSYLTMRDDSVFLDFIDEKPVKEIISGPKDGIAIDLVFKNQFICMEPDRIHPSTVFDGFMIKPVYRDQLFKNDRYANSEFESFLGIVPPQALREDLQINTILIQNGAVCRYSYPVGIENGILPDLPITPQWNLTEGTLKKSTANFDKTYEIPFEKNEKSADSYYFQKLKQQLEIFDGAITSIDITAYSSVEGTEAKNIELQNSRTAFLENYIRGCIKQSVAINKKSVENWDLFYKQLNASAYKDLFNDTTKSGLRAEVNKRMDEPVIENWLFDQRVASITLHVHKDYDNTIATKYLPLAIYDGITKANIEQSKIAYSRLISAYLKGDINKHYLTAIEIPLQKQNVPLINNYLASIMIESDIFDFQNYNPRYYTYIDSVRKMFSYYRPLAFNLCVYKAHLYFRHLLNNVTEFKNLENEVKAYEKDSMIDQTVLHHVLYNYYLTGSIYYKDMHMYTEMYRCFDKVKPLLSLASLNKKEVYDVGKYFNYFSALAKPLIYLKAMKVNTRMIKILPIYMYQRPLYIIPI